MTGIGGIADEMDVVAERIDYLELLGEEPLATQEIVSELDDSRSTVTRALRQLREAEFIVKTDEGYTVTAVGTKAVEAYRQYRDTSEAILSSKEVLKPLPGDVGIPPRVFRGAETYLAAERGAFSVLEVVTDSIKRADDVRGYLPTLSNPHLLRVCHEGIVSGESDIDLTVPADLFEQLHGRYPDLLGEMAACGLTVHTADGPEYGLWLTDRPGGPILSLLIYGEAGAIHALLQTEQPEAVAWATQRLDDVRSGATETNGQLEELARRGDGGTSSAHATGPSATRATEKASTREGGSVEPLPAKLRGEGFVQLSEDVLGTDRTSEPEKAWRTGFTLADVYAGRAVDRLRETETSEQHLHRHLVTRLQDGQNCVLLGPPGSGKSTVCKQVACEWYENGHGPVIYREQGNGEPVNSPAQLEAVARQTAGHALIVVEDVARPDAVRIFDTVSNLRDAADVSFLFDARQREWEELRTVEVMDEVAGGRRSKLAIVPMPEIDAEDCGRFVEQFESDVGTTTEYSDTDLLADIHERRGHDGRSVGAPLLIQHRLGLYADDTPGSAAETTLVRDAKRVCTDLADEGSAAALDVAVLATLLDAAGLSVAPDLLYSLVDQYSPESIDAAIEALEGKLLFAPPAGKQNYRTRHEMWGEHFLRQLPNVEGEDTARHRFERCVNGLFSLPEDEERRRRISDILERSTPNLNQLEYHPQTWSDEVVTRVFGVGRRNRQLAPLYGQTETSGIELPHDCSAELRARQAYWRGQIYEHLGETNAAATEYDRLYDLAEESDVSGQTERCLKALSLRAQGEIASLRGDQDAAEQHHQDALSLAEKADADRIAARALHHLGLVSGRRGDHDEGLVRYKRSLELAREAGDERTMARDHVEIGVMHSQEGNLEAAAESFEAGRELAREIGDRKTEANAAGHLGRVAHLQGDFERAQKGGQRKLELNRETGNQRGQALARLLLGRVARDRGDIETAREHGTRAVAIAREADSPRRKGLFLNLLSSIERQAGNLDEATEYAERAREAFEETDARYQVAEASYNLAAIALCRDDLAEVEAHLERTTAIRDEAEAKRLEAKFGTIAARLALRRDDLDSAIDRIETAHSTYRELGRPQGVAECLRLRAESEADRGNLDEASRLVETATEEARNGGVVHTIAHVAATAGEITRERGNLEAARAHFEKALENFDQLGDTESALEAVEALLAIGQNIGDEEATDRLSERRERLLQEG